jgi:hypothetical protein
VATDVGGDLTARHATSRLHAADFLVKGQRVYVWFYPLGLTRSNEMKRTGIGEVSVGPGHSSATSERMTNRVIAKPMCRLFHRGLGPGEYEYLMVDDELDRSRVYALLDRYIRGDELLICVNRNHCASASRDAAFDYIRRFVAHGSVMIADPMFKGRVVVNRIGVGAGWGS